jgi:tryptophan-rich hypothetical protein
MINNKKLLNSKWTALSPQNREKHFVVIKVVKCENDPQVIKSLTLEAVVTKRAFKMTPHELKQTDSWQEGWK